MNVLNPFIWANKGGIIRLEAISVNVNETSVVFNFQSHRFLNTPYSGLILFKLPSFTAPSTAIPVVFNTDGKEQSVTTLNGENVTSATLNGSGIYLAYYENNTLQILTGLI